jgi:hypothetical protein
MWMVSEIRVRFYSIHSITVAANSMVRSHHGVAYHDPLRMILQILVPGYALYIVEPNNAIRRLVSQSNNRL